MRSLFIILFPCCLVLSHGAAQSPEDARAREFLSKMTLEEKIDLLSGTGFATKPVSRLGIPALNMTDGPMGVRWGRTTAFPAGMAMAASWNPELIRRVGWAIGREVKGKGRHMLLGPCVNISRVPLGGRNFESFGEDPFLAGRMAVAYVSGVQENKVIACVKHYACNNQETERGSIDVVVDLRTLKEIYLPAFEAAVREAGVMSVMAAYNKVNGAHCSENSVLLTDILRKEWGFQGFVVSDWGATHSTVAAITAGQDLEMPTGEYYGAALHEAVRKGEVNESLVNERAFRLLRAMAWAGLFTPQVPPDTSVVGCEEHRSIAREAAAEGIVLLRNEGKVLPLDKSRLRSIAVIGPNAAIARTGGGGSSKVSPIRPVSTLEGIRRKLGQAVEVAFEPGCQGYGDFDPVPASALRCVVRGKEVRGLAAEYFDRIDLSGSPAFTRVDSVLSFDWSDASPAPGVRADSFSVRWTGALLPPSSGDYELSAESDDGLRVSVDGHLLIDLWGDHAPERRSARLRLDAGKRYALRVEYYERTGGAVAKLGWGKHDTLLLSRAVRAAQRCDAAVLCVGFNDRVESEGFDRATIDLPADQRRLIEAVCAANRTTIVVLTSGAPVVFGPELPGIGGLLETWYPGEEGGSAIADVLFGDVNPSGRLPVTFPVRWEDSPASATFPGTAGTTRYSEGVFVGYRNFDANKIEPLFPFGYGLSYTTFAYESLMVHPLKLKPGATLEARVTVRNEGARRGAEVVQLYVGNVRSTLPRPPRELKGFQKVVLDPGESRVLTFRIGPGALAFFDPERKAWALEPGSFDIQVGRSSRDIRGAVRIVLE
jgi:beta-glucosidase